LQDLSNLISMSRMRKKICIGMKCKYNNKKADSRDKSWQFVQTQYKIIMEVSGGRVGWRIESPPLSPSP